MRTDFVSSNISLWVDNWKRKDVISQVCQSWLDSFSFECVNVIVNHSSVTIDDFAENIRDKIRLWPNVMRHDAARGPINRNINQAYIHTFLSGRNYCIVAHDGMLVRPGWDDLIRNTDYDFYMAPQGDQVHIMTIKGLQSFGWWDERFATMGWHEIDYIVRAVRKAIAGEGKCSIVDTHGGYPNHFPFVKDDCLIYNSVGLEKHFYRMDLLHHPRIGERSSPEYVARAEAWCRKKWRAVPVMWEPNFTLGPMEEEIDWYPWLDIHTLKADRTAY